MINVHLKSSRWSYFCYTFFFRLRKHTFPPKRNYLLLFTEAHSTNNCINPQGSSMERPRVPYTASQGLRPPANGCCYSSRELKGIADFNFLLAQGLLQRQPRVAGRACTACHRVNVRVCTYCGLCIYPHPHYCHQTPVIAPQDTPAPQYLPASSQEYGSQSQPVHSLSNILTELELDIQANGVVELGTCLRCRQQETQVSQRCRRCEQWRCHSVHC